VGGGAVNKPAPDDTAVHPAWRKAFGYIDVPVFGVNTGVTSAQNATYQSIAAAADRAFYSGGKAIRAGQYAIGVILVSLITQVHYSLLQ